MFYSTNQKKCDLLVFVLADLICLAWAKEPIIDSIWDLIAPIASFNSPKNSSPNTNMQPSFSFNYPSRVNLKIDKLKNNKDLPEICDEKFHNKNKLSFNFQLSQFDRSLLILLHTIIVKLGEMCRQTALELCWNFLFPKLTNILNAEFSQFLAMIIMCAASCKRSIQQKFLF